MKTPEDEPLYVRRSEWEPAGLPELKNALEKWRRKHPRSAPLVAALVLAAFFAIVATFLHVIVGSGPSWFTIIISVVVCPAMVGISMTELFRKKRGLE